MVLNDNEMSIAKNVGAISEYLSALRTGKIYNSVKDKLKSFAMRVKGRILAGERLLLNMNALEMRDRLDADFGGWYDLLSSYYAETINQFTQAEEINAMRYSYATDSPDMVLHDGEDFPAYTPKLSEFNTPQMPIYRINSMNYSILSDFNYLCIGKISYLCLAKR